MLVLSIWSCVLQVCTDCTFRLNSTNLCRFWGILQSLGPQLLSKSSSLQCRFEKCSGSCRLASLFASFPCFPRTVICFWNLDDQSQFTYIRMCVPFPFFQFLAKKVKSFLFYFIFYIKIKIKIK